uniref:uncharacterized protein LOC122609846 n=1 Tax=Erigeron canadensis TaxID=72917 RepID=UPI001CB99AA5|nr:uncharacterized protein LOC122609846 [Erigeron canadensis]
MDTTTTTAVSPNLLLLDSLSLSSCFPSPSKSNLPLLKPPQNPPDFLNSINELSELSAALSAFLHDFHDLHNHITSVTSAIDAQLPPHLLLLNTTTSTEAICAERNPNGTEKSNGDETLENNNDVDDDLRKVLEESNDKLDGIDVLEEKNKVNEEDIGIWDMIEDVDCYYNALFKKKMKNKRKEGDIIDKINILLKKDPEKSVSFEEAGEIDTSKEDGEIETLEDGEIDTLENGKIDKLKEKDREVDVSKEKHKEIDISKEDGEIELEDGEIDMSKECDEINVSKRNRNEIHMLKKHKYREADENKIDMWEKKHKYREADENRISNKKHERSCISKRKHEQSERHIEIDKGRKKHEEIDKSKSRKKHEEDYILKKKHEEVGNLKKKDEQIEKKKNHDQTDAFKRPAEIIVLKKPEISDTLWKPEAEIDILKKPKERETPKEDGEDDTFNRPAENDGSKKPQEETDASKKLVENDILNKLEEINVPKEPQEETDASNYPVEIDILNEPEECDVSKKPLEETDAIKKPVEIDILHQPEEGDVLNKPEEINVSKKPDEIDLSNKPEEIDVPNKPEELDVPNKADEIDASRKPAISVLEFLCEKMFAKEMKKHVVDNISIMNSLHQEIAKALKLARNPAKLVLDSIGRFFLQASSAYHYGESRHQQIAVRQASVLILECFAMISSDGIEITEEDKEYAANATIDWRKRMLKEGGWINTEVVDARGLLLFISGFGIPDGVFSNEDLRDLIRASNVNEISNALRRSAILIQKLPEVIDWMVKSNLEIEAADVVYTFGLEDKCHPEAMLMTFLHKKITHTQNGSSLQVYTATLQQLSDLKSVRRCLKTHKSDPSKFLPGFNINEKIEQLEKVINELDLKTTEEKSTLKRKEKETEFSNDPNNQQQAKRSCCSHESLPHEQNPHDHYDTHPYNLSTLIHGYFDQDLYNSYVTTYSASSAFSAPVLPPHITSSVPAGFYAPCVYGGPVAEPMPHTNNPWPYVGQPYSSSFPRLPNYIPPNGLFERRVPSSDLYKFADTVVERGSHRGRG